MAASQLGLKEERKRGHRAFHSIIDVGIKGCGLSMSMVVPITLFGSELWVLQEQYT